MKTEKLVFAGFAVAAGLSLTACNDRKQEPSTLHAVVTEPTASSSSSLPVETDTVAWDVKLSNRTPADPAKAFQEGVALYEKRDYAAAAERLQSAAAADPDSQRAHYLLGLAQWKAGLYDEAETSLERASQLAPSSARTWINLARARMSSDDPGGALEAADAALAIEPLSADAQHQRGRALAGLGRTPEAVDVLVRAQEIAPNNGYIANTLGWVLLQAGRATEAVPLLEAARTLLPEIAYVRNNLGVAYERTGDLQRAADEYRAAIGAGDSGGKATASLARLSPVLASLADSPESSDGQAPPLVAERNDVGQEF